MFNPLLRGVRRPGLSIYMLALIATAGGALSTAALAAPIDSEESTVITTARQMNLSVDGKFNAVSGDISYDPAKPGAATATINIDMTSFDVGADDFNKTLMDKNWFDAKAFPTATFVANDVAAAHPGELAVLGKLTIKGRTRDVTVPMTVSQENGEQVFDGVLGIRRLAYGIGTSDPKDTAVVANEVDIKFHLVVKR